METTEQTSLAPLTPAMRYYLLNREEKLKKMSERYHNRPDVIAKKEERERLRAEKEAKKEAEKEAKKAEKKEKRSQRDRSSLEERIELAKRTSKKYSKVLNAPATPT